ADGAVGDSIRRYLASSADSARTSAGPVPLGPSLDLLRLEIAPNPVVSGGEADFTLELRARGATKLAGLAVLVYSQLEMRIAILDLRTTEFPLAIAANETRT